MYIVFYRVGSLLTFAAFVGFASEESLCPDIAL